MMRRVRVIVAAVATLVACGCAWRGGPDAGSAVFAPDPTSLPDTQRLKSNGVPPQPTPETAPPSETRPTRRGERRTEGADELLGLSQEVERLRAELDRLGPGMERFLDIENDIRVLLSQLAAISSVDARAPGAAASAGAVQPLSPAMTETPPPQGATTAAPITPLASTPPLATPPASTLTGQNTLPALGGPSPPQAAPLPPITTTPLPELGETPSQPSAPQRAPPPDVEGVYAHLASYRRADTARQGWRELSAAHTDLLSNQAPLIQQTDLGAKGVFQRLYAGPFATRATADGFCAGLSARGVYCQAMTVRGPAATAPIRSVAATTPAQTFAAAPQQRPASPIPAPQTAAPVQTNIAPSPFSAPSLTPADDTIPIGASGAAYVHLASLDSEEAARAAWPDLQEAHREALRGLAPRISPYQDANGRLYWRILAGPIETSEAATQVCSKIQGSGGFCRTIQPPRASDS